MKENTKRNKNSKLRGIKKREKLKNKKTYQGENVKQRNKERRVIGRNKENEIRSTIVLDDRQSRCRLAYNKRPDTERLLLSLAGSLLPVEYLNEIVSNCGDLVW